MRLPLALLVAASLAAGCASGPKREPAPEPARTAEAKPATTPAPAPPPAPPPPAAAPAPAEHSPPPPSTPATTPKPTPPPEPPKSAAATTPAPKPEAPAAPKTPPPPPKTPAAPAPVAPVTPPPAATPAPAAVPAAAGGGSVSGKVILLGKGGAPEPSAAGAVVHLPGVNRLTKPAGAKPTMTSKNKTFEPHVIAVPAGTTVEFPNVDKIHHNAFSLSDHCKFDLGLYKNGDSRPKTFDAPGVCRIYCNIHAQMSGVVVVTKGDASAVTGPDGTFRIDDLPPGKYELRVWHEKAGAELTETVEIAAGKDVVRELRLDVAGFKETAHLNKHGKPYGKDDEARY